MTRLTVVVLRAATAFLASGSLRGGHAWGVIRRDQVFCFVFSTFAETESCGVLKLNPPPPFQPPTLMHKTQTEMYFMVNLQ